MQCNNSPALTTVDGAQQSGERKKSNLPHFQRWRLLQVCRRGYSCVFIYAGFPFAHARKHGGMLALTLSKHPVAIHLMLFPR